MNTPTSGFLVDKIQCTLFSLGGAGSGVNPQDKIRLDLAR